MAYFFGEKERQIDSNNRLPVPKEWRAGLTDRGQNDVMLLARSNRIEVYPYHLFFIMLQDERRLSLEKQVADRKSRLGRLIEQKKVDAKGRVQLPPKLLKTANIPTGNVIVVGAIDHIEIWDPSLYQETEAADTDGIL